MKVLVIGSGGREHALVWKLAQSPLVKKIYCAPGNAGTALEEKCENLAIKYEDTEGLVTWAKVYRPDLTVVGPEVPLCLSIVDDWPEGLKIFGPTGHMAAIEGSKFAAKMVMQRNEIPTAPWSPFDNSGAAIAFLEDKLEGIEFSLLAICDGEKFLLLKVPKDHKPALDGDLGENTGGMGCYCPAPYLSPEQIADIAARGIAPVVAELGYRGVLYLGGMLHADGSWSVLEYNCRFGDPETQVILPLLDCDLAQLLVDACNFKLPSELNWYEGACVSVVLASGGYPGSYEKGKVISGLKEAVTVASDLVIFHAGTDTNGEGEVISAGGRVLNVTARGFSLLAARTAAYDAVYKIHFDGMQYRTDIGLRAGTDEQPPVVTCTCGACDNTGKCEFCQSKDAAPGCTCGDPTHHGGGQRCETEGPPKPPCDGSEPELPTGAPPGGVDPGQIRLDSEGSGGETGHAG